MDDQSETSSGMNIPGVPSKAAVGSSLAALEPSQEFRQLVGQKLNGLFFSGRYVDRVWVESAGTYKDRIAVDENQQADIIKMLKSLLRRASKMSPNFDGLQRNENEMSFFTSWSRCPPLGHYWFLVDAVIFRKTGFDLNLRILRSREDEEKSIARICPKCNHNLDSSPDASNSSDDTMNISDIAASLQRQFQGFFAPDEWWVRTKPYLTMENLVKCSKLVLLLGLAAITGLFHFMKNLLPMLNKTLLELGNLIQKFMPFLLAVLDTFNKIIGATFLMIHRLWTDLYHGPQVRQSAGSQRPRALDMPGTRYWSRQNVSETDNKVMGSLYALEGPGSSQRPKYPYLRRDVNRPYL